MNRLQEVAKRMAELILLNLRLQDIAKLDLFRMTVRPDKSGTTPVNNNNPYEPKVKVKINFLNDEVKK